MMAIGIVRGLIGSVTVTGRDGMTRELRVGDAVETNDSIQAATGATVHIAFNNGNFATVGSNEKLVLDQSVVDPMAEAANKAGDEQSVADIQAMIAAGADPTEVAEATAAGADTGTLGDPGHSGSHSFVVVDQEAARGNVTPGFETGTFSNPVPEREIHDGLPDTALLNPDTPDNPVIPDRPGTPDNPVTPDHPDNPDVPPANNDPVIIAGGDGLSLKESGVGTIDQGGKPGWAIGDHNHAISGKGNDEGSFTVRDADAGDRLTATLLDKNGNPLEGVTTDASGTMTVQTEYGVLTVTPVEGEGGSVTYTYHYELDNERADSLNESDAPVHEQFRIEVSDGHGGTVTQPVDITIEGTNDAPSFNGRGQNVQLKEEGVYNGNHETTEDHKNDGYVSDKNDRPRVEGELSKYVTDPDKGADLTYTVDHFNVKNSSVDSLDTTLYTGNNVPVVDSEGNPVQIRVEMVGTPTIDANGIQTIHTNYGTLTVDTNTGHYSFELGGDDASDKLVNGMAAGEKFSFQFETLVTDQFGAIGKHVLTVLIEGANDIPSLTVDKATLDVTEKGENIHPGYTDTDTGTAHGSDVDRGARLHYSLIDENGRETTSIKTEYGTLTIDADGKYHFTIDNDADAVKALQEGDSLSAGSFTIRVTDEHGAYTEQQIEVNVHGAKDAPLISDHLLVNEHGLDNPADASGSAALKAPDGYTIIGAENGEHGTVTKDASGNWHYTLNESIYSGNVPGANTVEGGDTVRMTVQDEHGNQFTVDVRVDIVDDVPSLTVGSDLTATSGGETGTAAGSFQFDFGADDGNGKSFTVNGQEFTIPAQGHSTVIEGKFGSLTINADGSYSYKAHVNAQGTDNFRFTVTDADGDTISQSIGISVTPSGITASHGSAIVSEHDVAGNDHVNAGSDASHGQDNLPGNPAANESGFSGHLNLDYGVNGAAHNGAFAWSVPSGNGVQAMVDGSWQSVTWSVNGTTLTGTAGGQTVLTLTIDPSTGNYQADLNAALKHNTPDASDLSDNNFDFSGQTDASAGLHFDYTITDASGNTAQGSLEVNVQDDVPVFSQSSDVVTVTDHNYYTDNTELKFTASNVKEGEHSISFGKDLTISTGTVHYGKDGNISDIDASDGVLHYKDITGTKWDGLGVQHSVVDSSIMKPNASYNPGDRFGEINYTQKDNSSEAIVIDLNGKIAYGMNIGLSNFFGAGGQAAEKALFTFYLNGEIVDVKELTSEQKSGLVNGTFNSVTAGFDKVVISAIDNGVSQGVMKDNSDFTITSIQFITASGQPLSTAEGHIEAQSADGIKSYDFSEMAFETADGEKISLSHTAMSNGDVIIGTLADGTVVLEGFLSDNGTWSLHQYQNGIHNVGSNGITLSFVATDNDGDRTSHQVVVPDTAVDHAAANDISGMAAETGNDMMTGDTDGATALAAAVAAAGGDASSSENIHQYLSDHPDFVDTLHDFNHTGTHDDVLAGGFGHDILAGQGGNDLLIGDGDMAHLQGGTLDHLHNLLGTHAQGDDPASGIHHLFDHGTAQEIHDFTSGVENASIESGHDGNDHLYGGAGNDVLIGMGGNDHLYGGEGHDVLLGGSGNDVLVGGKGDDILVGGTGNDTFKYTAGDLDGVSNGDTITDFHLGNHDPHSSHYDSDADVLDIADLITGSSRPDSVHDLFKGGYLQFDEIRENGDGTTTVKLSIDTDGTGGDSAHMAHLATITMTGVHFSPGGDMAQHTQELMDQLSHNDAIKF